MTSNDIETEMQRLKAAPLGNRRDPSEELLVALESSFGVTLPDSYREFLRRYSNYRVTATCGCPTLPGTYIEYFHGFPSDADFDPDALDFDDLGIAPNAFAIGCDMFGGQFLIFLTESTRGRIYFCDVEGGGGDFIDDPDWASSGLSFNDLPSFDETEEKPEAFQNLHFIAEDFLSFLAGLEPSAD